MKHLYKYFINNMTAGYLEAKVNQKGFMFFF